MSRSIFLSALSLAAITAPCSAQVLTDFVAIDGSFRLDDCGFDLSQSGIKRISLVDAVSSDVPPLTARKLNSVNLPTPALSAPYTFDVGVNSDPRTWTLKLGAVLGNNDTIFSRPGTTAALTSASSDLTNFNFSIDTALVTVRYLDDTGNPVSMTDSDLRFYTAGSLIVPQANIPVARSVANSFNRSGNSHQMLVRAGEDLRLRVRCFIGTDIYSDTNSFNFDFNELTATGELTTDAGAGALRFAACSTNTVTVRIPTGVLGRIRATVDMVGETELYTSGTNFLSSGFVENQRIDISALSVERPAAFRFAVRPLAPHSGEYVAQNLIPTTSLGIAPYLVRAHLYFENGGIPQTFRSPSLSGITLTPGQDLDLDLLDDPLDEKVDPFVMSRGIVRGRLSFCGPPAREKQTPMLSNINGTSGDDMSFPSSGDANARLAISTLGPRNGNSVSYLRGAFDAATGVYAGDYDYRVGDLYRNDSDWRVRAFSMQLSHSSTTVTDDYFNQNMVIQTLGAPWLTIVDQQTISGQDFSYDFGEVLVRFRARERDEPFYSPIVFPTGGFGSPGDPVYYNLGFTRASGLPQGAANSDVFGSVRLLLPRGTYNLSPRVTAQATGTTVAFPPLPVQVEGKSYQVIDPPLQPPVLDHLCFSEDTPLTGRIISRDEEGNEVKVEEITVIYDGNEYTVPVDGEVNPSFKINFSDLGITPLEGDSFITIIAKGSDGRESRIEVLITNDTEPPVINHPDEVIVEADPSLDCAAVVDFEVTATDNCPGPLRIRCNPPSGSVFPVGSTTVVCTATDHVGNQSSSRFTVTVQPHFRLCEGVIAKWDPACSVLQCSEDLQSWSDVLGAKPPYCYAYENAEKKFFRLRPLTDDDRPDLIITRLVTNGASRVLNDGSPAVPVILTVRNQGTRPAEIFKFSATFDSSLGASFLNQFRVRGQGSFLYPFTPSRLLPGCEITFEGEFVFAEREQGRTTTVTVLADSCAGEEFTPVWCRVLESNEDNNTAEINLQLPSN